MDLMWRDRVRRVVNAAPNFMVAWAFLFAWIAPDRFGKERIPDLFFVVLLEFFAIHSAPFLNALALERKGEYRVVRWGLLIGLSAFYTIMVGAFSMAFGRTLWLLFAFWGLTLNRLSSYLLSPPDETDTPDTTLRWGLTAALYLLTVVTTAFWPFVPRLGVDTEISRLLGAPAATGVWVEEPQRLLATGFLYFAGMGLIEILELDRRWITRIKQTPPT